MPDNEQHYAVFEEINAALWRSVEHGRITSSDLHSHQCKRQNPRERPMISFMSLKPLEAVPSGLQRTV
ncbi:MAG: hypothetical protein AAF962_14600 [Actinomycetota bacterium]